MADMIKAWKRFAQIFPDQTSVHAGLILDAIRCINFLEGAYHGARCDLEKAKYGNKRTRSHKSGKLVITQTRKTAQELWKDMQRMLGTDHCVKQLVLNYFGINMNEEPTFDPVELRDSAHCDAEVRKILGLDKH